VAEARNDSFCRATATGELATALANLGELDASHRAAEQALADASTITDPNALAIAIVCASSAYLISPSQPDFDAARRVLEAHPVDLADVGAATAGWLLAVGGAVELGLGRLESATTRLVASIRLADRTGGNNMMHQATLAVGVGAAEARETVLACELVGYADAHLGSLRVINPFQDWLKARLDTLLADLDRAERARATQRGAALDRQGLMRLLRQAEETFGVQPAPPRGVQPTR
jgi:hypothetical protein